jgi:hypothetical protein
LLAEHEQTARGSGRTRSGNRSGRGELLVKDNNPHLHRTRSKFGIKTGKRMAQTTSFPPNLYKL